jgi:hypothetical protein
LAPTSASDDLKRCTKCEEEKLRAEFSRDRSRKDDRYPQCKACGRQWHQKNSQRSAEYHRGWQRANRYKQRAQNRRYRERKRNDPEYRERRRANARRRDQERRAQDPDYVERRRENNRRYRERKNPNLTHLLRRTTADALPGRRSRPPTPHCTVSIAFYAQFANFRTQYLRQCRSFAVETAQKFHREGSREDLQAAPPVLRRVRAGGAHSGAARAASRTSSRTSNDVLPSPPTTRGRPFPTSLGELPPCPRCSGHRLPGRAPPGGAPSHG